MRRRHENDGGKGEPEKPEKPAKPDPLAPFRFKPGATGNPGGRPKELPELRASIRKRGLELVAKLFAIVDSPRSQAGDRIKAIGMLMAYGYGKPTEVVEVSGPDGGPIKTQVDAPPDYSKYTSGELRKLLDEKRRLLREQLNEAESDDAAPSEPPTDAN